MVNRDTIIRTVILFMALINQILTSTGHTMIPVSDDQIAEAITLAVTIGASVWAWWKNNSFTREAIKADAVMRELKEVHSRVV